MQAIHPDYWTQSMDQLSQHVHVHAHYMPGRHFGFLEHPKQTVNIISTALSSPSI